KCGRSRSAVRTSDSGSTFTSPSTGMKLVSPFQRGTTCRCTWSSIPAPATRPMFHPRLNPCGAYSARSASAPAAASRCTSSASSSESAPKSPTWRCGATRRWPDEYGNLFRTTSACGPRWTSSSSSGAQKMQRSSSSACCTYSRRHGAHSGFGTGPTLPSRQRPAHPLRCGRGAAPGAAGVYRKGQAAVRALAVLLAALVFAGAAAADTNYTDGTGENPAAVDISGVVASNDPASGTFTLKIQVANMPTFADDAIFGVAFDTDRNASTGDQNGFDYQFLSGSNGWAFQKWDGTQFTSVTGLGIVVGFANGLLTATFHATDLGSPKALDFLVVTLKGADPQTAVTDAAPDTGL